MIKKQWHIPLFIALLIFGMLVSIQYKTQLAVIHSLSNQKTEDLVALVKNLNEKRNMLESEVEELNRTKRSLEEKSTAGQSLVTNLEKEMEHLKTITGTIPVQGPGISITITGDSFLMYQDLIDLVNELWVSGAEAVAINEFRITNNTVISHGEDANHQPVITINNQQLLYPIVIRAIGKADTLEKGLTFTGGIIDNFNTIYQVYPVIKKEKNLKIPAIISPASFKYLKW
ncbi:MAG: DUF881 domain-containing protein [Bacillota bacterium]|jgi:uncharacterized protein YlxW (UPF0749 family)